MPQTSETARRTGNQAWPLRLEGTIARKLSNNAMNLKVLAQREANPRVREEMVLIANNIIDESQRVDALETQVPVT